MGGVDKTEEELKQEFQQQPQKEELPKTLVEILTLRGQALEKLEKELMTQLDDLKLDELVLKKILESGGSLAE